MTARIVDTDYKSIEIDVPDTVDLPSNMRIVISSHSRIGGIEQHLDREVWFARKKEVK